ncbi:hypothetical protein ACFWGD_09995, partial [Corynebacterium sp. NPDC060344]|uniref:hypothetical protein n=1 Tax=Corynebacterium sp. NPDC060344 TaxID=3347101 RepID=UPI003648AD8E
NQKLLALTKINTKNSTSAHYRVLKKHTHTLANRTLPDRVEQQEKNLAHPISTAQTVSARLFVALPPASFRSALRRRPR